MTHCGFGPENPMPPSPLGYGPPVYLCDNSSTSVPSGSSSIDAVPCTWTLSYGLAGSKITTAARGSRFKLAVLRRLLGSANRRSSPSRITQTTVECGVPSASSVDSTAKFVPSNSVRTGSVSCAIGLRLLLDPAVIFSLRHRPCPKRNGALHPDHDLEVLHDRG